MLKEWQQQEVHSSFLYGRGQAEKRPPKDPTCKHEDETIRVSPGHGHDSLDRRWLRREVNDHIVGSNDRMQPMLHVVTAHESTPASMSQTALDVGPLKLGPLIHVEVEKAPKELGF